MRMISTIRELQKQFLDMTNMIKLYRAFIPVHLLQQLDKKNLEEEQKPKEQTISSHRTENNKKQQPIAANVSSKCSSSDLSSVSLASRSTHNTSLQKNSRNLNMFSLYLEKKNVTLLHMVLDGFSAILSKLEHPNECLHMLSDVFDQVNTTSKIAGGLLGNFENDSFTISFNSSIQNVNHQEKGTLSSKQLLERIMVLKTISILKKDQLMTLIEVLKIRIALIQQECRKCGNS
ncbi:hypothetical protein FDP41_000694 [Naegleria fowleri]|uniref:Uncharacterized protein n=1 Tax=Naegleria fowleri TaxID=5763 RepID=A0A6A5CHL9_NAEFO|nr:uncharacterized protein FDP41_000694 [Naegleria fowleri]KAF0984795.1 hypothetical protein FDP41_000694 [Naegleria fowleri]